MKHHPDLFDAQTLHHDTRLLFKLKLLLGTVCAYGGEVPLSQTELAKRMGTSTYRIRILLHKLEHEGIIHYNNAGTLFFDRYIFVRDQAEVSQETLYAKNFAFFTCDEFCLRTEMFNALCFITLAKSLSIFQAISAGVTSMIFMGQLDFLIYERQKKRSRFLRRLPNI